MFNRIYTCIWRHKTAPWKKRLLFVGKRDTTNTSTLMGSVTTLWFHNRQLSSYDSITHLHTYVQEFAITRFREFNTPSHSSILFEYRSNGSRSILAEVVTMLPSCHYFLYSFAGFSDNPEPSLTRNWTAVDNPHRPKKLSTWHLFIQRKSSHYFAVWFLR